MYERYQKHQIIDDLNDNPAVVIFGPRQIGKTTLAREISKQIPSVYLDLEDNRDFGKFTSPYGFCDLHADKLIILDGTQQHPELFQSLKDAIDSRRREGRGNGQFLLLSALSNHLCQGTEFLAERIHFEELVPLSPFEIESPYGKPLQKLWLRGGFLKSYGAASDEKSYKWRKDVISQYINREFRKSDMKHSIRTLRKLWTLLAHTQGESVNIHKLSTILSIRQTEVEEILSVMKNLMLLRDLEPLNRKTKKRLSKSPRFYIKDSGILHALLKIPVYDKLVRSKQAGKSWEGFVVENVTCNLPSGVTPYYYRTETGEEINLVLEFAEGELWAIEITVSQSPTLTKGFRTACREMNVDKKFVIYSGDSIKSVGHDTVAYPLADFINIYLEEACGRSRALPSELSLKFT